MFNQVVVILCLHFATVSSLINRLEHAKIQAEVEYVARNVSMLLGDVSNINSVVRCASQCMLNELCLTATYYEDLSICRLFSADGFQGNTSSKFNTKVISLVDRGKKHTYTNIVAMEVLWTLIWEISTSRRDCILIGRLFHPSTNQLKRRFSNYFKTYF